MTLKFLAVVTACLTVCVFAGNATAQVSIFPSSPKSHEKLRARVPGDAIVADTATRGLNSYEPRFTRVSMAGNKVTVTLVLTESGFPIPYSPPLDQPLGQLPEGEYQLEIVRQAPDGSSLGSLGATTFTVAGRAAGDPLWNLTDIWWNPAESGWGINIIHHGLGKIFATWFVYGSDGKPTWYVVPDGQWVTQTEYRGPVYRTTGSDFGGPFDPAVVTRTLVGSATISLFPFDYSQVGITFVIDGQTTQKTITPQSF